MDKNKKKITELHSNHLYIYNELQRICAELKIQCFAMYGTLLGSVRHGGFIPWDDDLDVGILREDYDKFLKLAPAIISDEFFIDERSSNQYMGVPHTKIKLHNTVFQEYSTKNTKLKNCIFIDVFPIDNASSDDRKTITNKRKISRLSHLLKFKSAYLPMNPAKKLHHVIAFAIRLCAKLISRKRLLRRISVLEKKFIAEASNKLVCWHSPYLNDIHLRTDIFPLSKNTFENIMIDVPNNSSAVLRTIYGDYNELPPEDKRSSLHYVHEIKCIDLSEKMLHKMKGN